MPALKSLADAAPAIAVLWAVYAYYQKRRHEREDELRIERAAIYRKYLSALREKIPESVGDQLQSRGIHKMTKIGPHHEKLSLIAPDPVVKASLKLINSHIGEHNFFDNEPLRELSATRKPSEAEFLAWLRASEKIKNARSDLVHEMRKDLIQGTGIDPRLTSVEEIAL